MIFILLSAIVILLVLIGLLKVNAFIALTISSLYVGIVNGMPIARVLSSVSNGIGQTLGPLILVLGLGVILGCLLTESGAANQITNGLIKIFGVKYIKWAMVLTGFCVGMALFYNAGFIVLIPLAYAVAARAKLRLVYITIAMASALSVTHGFLPPHPGPVAIAGMLKADIGRTLIYGLIIAVPALLCAGIVLPQFLLNMPSNPQKVLFNIKEESSDKNPSFIASILMALVPVLLMGFATAYKMVSPAGPWSAIIQFIGDPAIALLIAVILAGVLLSWQYGHSFQNLMEKSTASLSAIAGIILIIAAGGAFKQVLTDSGCATVIAGYFINSSLSPLFLGWLVATLLRISIGSATVSGLMAAGIVQPLIGTMHVSPELMVLSIGAGSLMCSHVNDTGFWMFKEYVGLSLSDTFRSWTVMESVIGLVGLAGVMVLSLFIKV
jgi:gluconate transporter